jgi:hypothetical protein
MNYIRMRKSWKLAMAAAGSIAVLAAVGALSGQQRGGMTQSPEMQAQMQAQQKARQDDHSNMMQQLGIKALRPGPSGTETAPNHANYDEATANPYPNLPDPLKLKNGQKVTTPEMWWKQRRPEIVEDFDREVYGRVPKNVPKVKWTVMAMERGEMGGVPYILKYVKGVVDNSAYPKIEVNIRMNYAVPANAKGPVPVMTQFGGAADPGAGRGMGMMGMMGGAPAAAGRGAASGAAAAGAGRGAPAAGGRAMPAAPAGPQDPSWQQQLLSHGWGWASINPGSIQADNGGGLRQGIIGLTNKGEFRKPDQWGSLRAWAWGASRVLDYFETDKAVDAKHVGIDGVSRYGKAALVTMAYDQRFAAVLIGSSGEGGAKLHRRNWGEAVENLTGMDEYHWMAGNFLKYGASDAAFGSKNPGDLPVDSHELIAMCAPRLTFVSYGVPERGDAKWLDHQGSFMAAIAAQPVFRLLGAKGLGRSDDYKTEKMPDVNVSLMDGQLAWRQHDGGHTDGPNWKYFIAWCDKFFKLKPAAASTAAPSPAPAKKG